MDQKKLEILNKKNQLFLEYFEKYDDKFSLRRTPIYKNKKRLLVKIKKKKTNNLLSIWSKIPFSLIIYTFNPKNFHHMSNYLYSLKEFIIIKKSRKFTKNNITGFDCYRIYSQNFLKLYDNIEDILNYDVNILGIEINEQLYSLQEISKYFQTIKEDIKFLFNIVNNFNTDFNNIFNNFGQIDMEFNQNLQEILIICQHIINSDAEQEQ